MGKLKFNGTLFKNAMVNSIGYTQRHYQEKQDIKAEKLGSHWKLRDQNLTVVNWI